MFFCPGVSPLSIRIYKLVNELKIEKEYLWELCDKLNIVAKGKSALASISDEDALRVREYVSSLKSDSDKCHK